MLCKQVNCTRRSWIEAKLTWMLMILGRGCLVFAPPSIAMPSIAFVFRTDINKLPFSSGTMCDKLSWFRKSTKLASFSSVGKRCIDYFSMLKVSNERERKKMKSVRNPINWLARWGNVKTISQKQNWRRLNDEEENKNKNEKNDCCGMRNLENFNEIDNKKIGANNFRINHEMKMIYYRQASMRVLMISFALNWGIKDGWQAINCK